MDHRAQRGPMFQFRRCGRRYTSVNCLCVIRGASGGQGFTLFLKAFRATDRGATAKSIFNRLSLQGAIVGPLVSHPPEPAFCHGRALCTACCVFAEDHGKGPTGFIA
eukprot:4039413-Pyramimonas_sp.AAC.1